MAQTWVSVDIHRLWALTHPQGHKIIWHPPRVPLRCYCNMCYELLYLCFLMKSLQAKTDFDILWPCDFNIWPFVLKAWRQLVRSKSNSVSSSVMLALYAIALECGHTYIHAEKKPTAMTSPLLTTYGVGSELFTAKTEKTRHNVTWFHPRVAIWKQSHRSVAGQTRIDVRTSTKSFDCKPVLKGLVGGRRASNPLLPHGRTRPCGHAARLSITIQWRHIT